MCRELMRQCGQNGDDFFMKADPDFKHRFEQLQKSSKITLVLGVRFAFMEWINAFDFGSEVILIETGGMKNRGKDLSRQAFINLLQDKTRASAIYSEYGMTELFSQCYAKNREPFKCPPSMRVLVRSESNPNLRYSTSKSGAMDIIDLANIELRHDAELISGFPSNSDLELIVYNAVSGGNYSSNANLQVALCYYERAYIQQNGSLVFVQ